MDSERFMLLYNVKQRVFLLRWVRNFIMSREGLISALPPYINVPLQMHHAHTPRLPYAALLLPPPHCTYPLLTSWDSLTVCCASLPTWVKVP